jgi:cell division protein FtsL
MMKIKKYRKSITNFLGRLNDIRFFGQIIFVVIVLMVSWSGIKAIQTNYNLQKQITALNQQNDIQKLQNENLQLENQYYQSNQYLELSARQNFGLAAPGEQEVIVPAQVALDYTVNLPGQISQTKTSNRSSSFQNNSESWVNFFLHRPNN